jgi:surface polysaccharide O-acyltransferase-like enzyme
MSKKNHLIFGTVVALFAFILIIFTLFLMAKGEIQLGEILAFGSGLSNLVLGIYFIRNGLRI